MVLATLRNTKTNYDKTFMTQEGILKNKYNLFKSIKAAFNKWHPLSMSWRIVSLPHTK